MDENRILNIAYDVERADKQHLLDQRLSEDRRRENLMLSGVVGVFVAFVAVVIARG